MAFMYDTRNDGTKTRVWHMLRTGVFFALATGLIESAIIVFRQFALRQFVWTPPFHIWAAPLIYIVVFLVAGLPLISAVALGWRRERAPVYWYAFLSAWILTLPFAQLGRIAPVILALGIATQCARIIHAHPAGFRRVARSGTLAMLGIVILMVAGLPLIARTTESWRMRRLGDARAGVPNVVLIILDTVRAASMQIYGYPLANTPNLERRAREGVIFDRAISTSSWTLPTHASLLTGQWVHDLDVKYRRPLGNEVPTLAEVLRDNGYATGGFVGNDRYTFQDSRLNRGFIRYDDFLFTQSEVLRSPVLMQTSFFRDLSRTFTNPAILLRRIKEFNFKIPAARWGQRKNADTVSANFMAWAKTIKSRPFFAFLNYYDAHVIYRCPPPFREQFDCTSSKSNAYHGSIAYLDSELEQLFREMEKHDLMRNTIIIVTSDHGEQFGEHGLNGHGNSLYMPLLHVPLIVWGPGLPGNQRVATAVSLRDVAATVLEMAAISQRKHGVPGTSLSPHWKARSDSMALPDSPLFSQIISDPYRSDKVEVGGRARISLIRGHRHYILSELGREELYDYVADAGERRDLKQMPSERMNLQSARLSVGPVAAAQGADSANAPRTARGVAKN